MFPAPFSPYLKPHIFILLSSEFHLILKFDFLALIKIEENFVDEEII